MRIEKTAYLTTQNNLISFEYRRSCSRIRCRKVPLQHVCWFKCCEFVAYNPQDLLFSFVIDRGNKLYV